MSGHKLAGYSGLQVLLHWTIAALVFFQLIFGESMTTVRDAAEEGAAVSSSDAALASAHYWIGLAILALVLARLVLRVRRGVPELAETSSALVSFVAKAAHFLFYLLLVAMPVTGLLTIYVSDSFGDIHTIGKPVFIVLIALHAAGALFHQFWLKDGTLRRMLVPAN